MPKMSPSDLRALLAAERADALSAMSASKLSEERAAALDYYLGDMARDMPAPDGRSKAVSTDVADTIEGLMPSLMEIFTGGDEVVRFEPVGPEDVDAAEQETDYVNHVFMQQNSGFLVLYSFIKDALLSKVGVVKVWWETREQLERETYLDLDDAAFAIVSADPDVEIVEHTVRQPQDGANGAQEANGEWRIANSEEGNSGNALGVNSTQQPVAQNPQSPEGLAAPIPAQGQAPLASPYSPFATRYSPPSPLHDVTVQTRRTYQSARVEGVTPEEFGISRRARSIRDTDYCFHDVLKSESALIAEGFDREQVKRLPSYTLAHTIEEQARDTVNESTLRQGDDGLNSASRLIRITEHYVRMDYEGDSQAALYRVTTAGERARCSPATASPTSCARTRSRSPP